MRFLSSAASALPVQLAHIRAAAKRLRQAKVPATPLLSSAYVDDAAGVRVHFKAEHLQVGALLCLKRGRTHGLTKDRAGEVCDGALSFDIVTLNLICRSRAASNCVARRMPCIVSTTGLRDMALWPTPQASCHALLVPVPICPLRSVRRVTRTHHVF